jgi:hypothetical protein
MISVKMANKDEMECARLMSELKYELVVCNILIYNIKALG